MFKKKILLAFLLLFLFSANFAFALEVTYPNIPFLPKIDQYSKLPQYISYFFGLAIYLSGILALISFAVGAIQLIMSAENPENASNAKDRMKGSILGLVLTLSAFIILRTINPVLVTPSLTSLGEVAGIYLTNGTDTIPVSMEVADTSTIPDGYNKIIYKCAANAYSPPLLIWVFPNINFQGNEADYFDIETLKLDCEHTIAWGSFKSFKIAFQTPGVYYCLEKCSNNWCSGYMSGANVSSGELSAPFKDNVKSIVFVNNPAEDHTYGVIFHNINDPKRGGICSHPIGADAPSDSNIYCKPNEYNVSSSADIFLWNITVPKTSGKGVDFYSKPFGWNSGTNAGMYSIDENLRSFPFVTDDVSNLIFDYNDVSEDPKYKETCKTFLNCPGSIRIKGNYLVGLWSQVDKEGNQYCQTFYEDVPNLKKIEFTAAKNILKYFYIIPIK